MERKLVFLGLLVFGVAVLGYANLISSVTPEAKLLVAAAGEHASTFTIAKMTCSTCPISVGKAIKKVNGVHAVSVDLYTKTASVVFDPEVTTTVAIAQASTRAGYPAIPIQSCL